MTRAIAPLPPSHADMVSSILSHFDRATPADSEAGATWYGSDSTALLLALVTAGAPSVEHAAAVVSHLSPRTTWARNVAAAMALVTGGPDAAVSVGAMRANVERAWYALRTLGDPLHTFGRSANKTRAFARNLLGDRDAVTVDVWAARVAGVTDERTLKRVGAYAAIADAYRAAAAARGVDPTTMQATTWIVARNGRAA